MHRLLHWPASDCGGCITINPNFPIADVDQQHANSDVPKYPDPSVTPETRPGLYSLRGHNPEGMV